MLEKGTREKAEELAIQYVKKAGICAQCVVAALMDAVGDGVINETLVKAATGLAGGIGRTSGEVCGALSGAVLALSAYTGRDYEAMKNGEPVQGSALDLSKELLERFQEEYEGCSCLDVQKKLLGAGYVLSDPEQAEKYRAAGGNSQACPMVCGNAAGWAVELLEKSGAL